MNILIVTDAYPPMRTSGACHIYDLGQAFVKAGSQANIIVPDSAQEQDVNIHIEDGVKVIRVKALHTKDVGYLQRTIAEFLNPFLMWRRLKKNSQFPQEKIDGVIWYSPSIFFGPLIKKLKKNYSCKSYLILRDIFPDWAQDIGLLNKGVIFNFFKLNERYQYAQADRIGVQSPNNLTYLKKHNAQLTATVEVLWNWIGYPRESKCSINLSKTKLAGKKIIVYAGNMGVAQGMDALIELASKLTIRDDVGFVFVGRGSEVNRLKRMIKSKKINNTIFYDEIESDEVPGLLRQCAIGLIGLDPRHLTHNIPGKFLSYLQSKLRIIAIANNGNDLADLVKKHNLGVFGEEITEELVKEVNRLIDNLGGDSAYANQDNILSLIENLFSPSIAVKQITSFLNLRE